MFKVIDHPIVILMKVAPGLAEGKVHLLNKYFTAPPEVQRQTPGSLFSFSRVIMMMTQTSLGRQCCSKIVWKMLLIITLVAT